ncbi:hypothetical protein M513_03079 [Trichuris suis]|nr:hypothetical protein M513_03079 [Trichuris suis]
MSLKECLEANVPDLDSTIKEYILNVLTENAGMFESALDVEEAVGPLLLSCNVNMDFSIVKLCQEIVELLKKNVNASLPLAGKLLAPVHLASLHSESNSTPAFPSTLKCPPRSMSQPDVKKLEKVEKKLLLKQEKRESKGLCRPHSTGELTASVSHRINRREENSEARGQNLTRDINVESIDVSYGNKRLLVNADLRMYKGKRYGLVGRNGVGKTTLLRMISSGNIQLPSHMRILHVEQEVEGDDTLVIDSVLQADTRRQKLLQEEGRIREGMGSTSDKSADQLSVRLQEVYEELQAIEADKAFARAAGILFGLGFDSESQKRPTKEYSGGWRMRVALARALFVRPDLLLLDEPTNMLDMKTVLWLENYLLTWPTILCVVSHDREFLNNVATEIIYMHNLRLEYYNGNYDQFEKTKTELLANQQREYEAQKMHRAHVQEFIDRFRYNAKRASLVQSKIKMLEKLPELLPVEVDPPVVIKFPPCDSLNPPIIQLENVSFHYAKERPVLRNVNFSASMESRICLVGDNGSGKTTFLKLIVGMLDPVKGERRLHRLLKVAYFTQHHVDQLVMDVNPVELIQQRYPGTKYEECRSALGRFGITGDLALQRISTLSGGQKSRLAFSLLSVMKPNFLILDEPTNHLDIETVDALGEALRQFGGGVIVVTHEERLIKMVCKELLIIRDGIVTQLEGGIEEYKACIQKELAKLI